jgi:hypothetical protein
MGIGLLNGFTLVGCCRFWRSSGFGSWLASVGGIIGIAILLFVVCCVGGVN